MNIHTFPIGPITAGGDRLFLIAGPCMAESRDLCFTVAEKAKGVCDRLGIGYIFKASFDKANRTSGVGPRGPGREEGLAILRDVKDAFGVPALTDIHESCQAAPVAEVCDVLQIPAFLCRQTDLLLSAAATGKPVNVKKGQFLSPWDMKNAVAKLEAAGAAGLLLTERGASFGYNNLVVDYRSLPVMRTFGWPVVFDATHSAQLPGGSGTSSGGMREHIPALTRAAMAVGVDGLFLEVHPDPGKAWSDAATQWPLDQLESLLVSALKIREAARG
jgi:2-dehydro-3-deoxyphosphooctonate aldolase (KDO 8-P synthase)